MPLPECLVSLLGITGFLVGALPGVDDFPVIGVPWMEAGGEKRQRIDHKSSGEDSRCEVQPLNGAQCRGDVRELPIFPEEIQPVTVHQRQEKGCTQSERRHADCVSADAAPAYLSEHVEAD